MTFRLEVEFSGLCGHLRHPDDRQVGIILPDGRRRDSGPVDPGDGDQLVWHVGYLRYDLADTGVDVPTSRKDGTPSFEVVHRFNGEELDFGLDFDKPLLRIAPNLPQIEQFAPSIFPIPGLFSAKPPDDLLMRCVLRGGSITSAPSEDIWKFSRVLNPGGKEYIDRFAGFATWKRIVEADVLHLTLKGWDGAVRTRITLTPRGPDQVIRLKIANLCAVNPLEWTEMFLRTFTGHFDDDFKWFYRLLRHPDGDFKHVLPPGAKLPVPQLVETRGGGPDDCSGHDMVYDFTQDTKPDTRAAADLRARQERRPDA